MPEPVPLPDAAIRDFVTGSGLCDPAHPPTFAALTGGVASDIWRVVSGTTTFCVKRALPKLRVAAEWSVPIERSLYEVEWLKSVGRIIPDAAPRILAGDPDGNEARSVPTCSSQKSRNAERDLEGGEA